MEKEFKFKVGDEVIYKKAKKDIHKGILEILELPHAFQQSYHVKQVDGAKFDFFLGEDLMELVHHNNTIKEDTKMSNPQTVDSVPTKDEKVADSGKFSLTHAITEYFETAEMREHYIKEHLETIQFDSKVELLKNGKFEKSSTDEDGETLKLVVTLGEEK